MWKFTEPPNVNSFNCSYNAKLPENEFEVTLINKGDLIEIQHEALFLKVLNFKCPNPQMTNDLHALLEYRKLSLHYFSN